MNGHTNQTAAVRPGEELDWARLDLYLKSVIAGLEGSPAVSQYPSGASNLTYRLSYPGKDLVVRRPPFGTKAASAHSMIREYRVMNALRPVYPAVPETLHYTDDESVIGAEFYVMRCVEGQKVSHTIPARWHFSRRDTRRFCTAFWNKLVELHRVDFAAAGLSDFGKPDGYARRQVLGWNERYRAVGTPGVDSFDDVQDWLTANIPPARGRAAVLHGDFRMDNVIFGTDHPCEVKAVLDWEISALGDPLMDLGNALAYWVEEEDPDYLRGLQLQPSMAPGMLSRREILELYARETGHDTSDFSFYYTFGMFRNIVILQQIYYRFFNGQTSDRRFSSFGSLADGLGNYCRKIIREK